LRVLTRSHEPAQWHLALQACLEARIGLHFRRDNVHRLAGHVDGEQEDAVGIEFGVDGGGHWGFPLILFCNGLATLALRSVR
jgi:hypothetical protein